MQLDYLWINSFRVLKNIELNFSTQCQYNYDNKSRRLSHKEFPNPLKGFFGENITEVTALIGSNGAGKSTIFDFINRNLANHQQGAGEFYEDGDFIAVFNNIIYTKSVDLIQNNEELTNEGFEMYQPENNQTMYYLPEVGLTDYGKLKFIYYSNVFDLNINYYDPNNLIDISTNNLLREESYTSDEKTGISIFNTKEIKRQLDFISEFTYDVPFKLPEEIFINIDEEAIVYKHKITYKDLEKKGLKELGDYIYSGFLRSYQKDFRSLLQKNIIEYRSYTLAELYKGINPELLFSTTDINVQKIQSLTSVQAEEINKVYSLLNDFDRLVSLEVLIISEEDENEYETIRYKISEDNSTFYNFLKSYNSLVGLDSFLHPYWRNLSSGEKAFLTLFSRLNFASKRMNEEFQEFDNTVDSLVLMIDELDLYFHPEWQRRYLSILLELIPQIFRDKKVQLILSTHSPFIASDLPVQNIKYLQKKVTEDAKEFESCTITVKNEQDSFGANIYSLLADSFYMEDGFVGEFAQSKIKQLLEILSSESSSPIDALSKEELMFRINLIGEPVIKQKLLDLFSERKREISLEDQIRMKEEELKLLRKKQKE